jgi:class 3 adenylate cyclase/tetratricopeptide (TPR) repeat protein
MQCPSCQSEVSGGARFCEQCGTALAARSSAAPVRADAERRQVTILFSDLVDSTALSHRVDPEELRDLLNAYHEACSAEIRRFGGFVAQYLGDGILAFFGYPVAHERDAQAAIQAGLALVAAMQGVQARGGAERVSVRVGVHTGLVVTADVGAAGKRDRLAIGSTPNVAARVQSLARPDSVVISESTYRLAGRFFDCTDLGVQAFKGVEGGLRCYEVQGEAASRSALVSSEGTVLSPLVGREEQVAQLAACWERVRGGAGHVVLVSGEAGLGKSRLLLELRRHLEGAEHRVLECICSPFTESSAFFPVIDALRREWQLGADDAATQLARLRDPVEALAPGFDDALPLLASLLSVPLPDDEPPLELAPQRLKERTLALLLQLLSNVAAQTPLLLVVEDLHWMDPSTRELLERVVEAARQTRVLVLLLFRPSFECPWQPGPDMTRFDLERLGTGETKALIRSVAGGLELPPEIVREILDKVDGVPLYVEEITKMVLESDALVEADGRYELRETSAALAVPPTLQESLMARLDRVATSRDVVQLAATLGRSFDYALLRAVADRPEAELEQELSRLVEAEILHGDLGAHGRSYVFKHALIQDAAYESLLRGKRRISHLRIAQVIEAEFPALAKDRPELLLHHFAAAERPAEAIPYALLAGSRAKERSALVESRTHFRRGLALLEGLEDAERAAELELQLLIELGPVLVSTQGYSNPEVEAVYARARELSERAGGDLRQRFTVLSGLLLFHQSRSELQLCVELTRQRMEIARKLGDPTLEMLCHENFGTLAIWRGEIEYGLSELREALARYRPEGGRTLRLLYGTDVSVISRAYEAQALVYGGHFERGRTKALEAIEVGRQLGHLASLALALNFGAGLHNELGDGERGLALAEETHALASREHLALWIGSSVAQRVRSLTLLGDPEAAIASFFAGTAAFQATGASIGGRFFVAGLADAYLAAGRAAEGLAVLDAALAGLAKCEDCFYDADLHRVRGSLLRATSSDPALAEPHYREAIALARRHQNRLLELRATTGLADLLREAARGDEALALLGPLYESFEEGWDALPLRSARSLLDTLRG